MCALLSRGTQRSGFDAGDGLIFRAMKWNFEQFDSYADRVRRSSREIIIAAVLTVAAFAFLLAAMVGGAVSTDKVGSVASDQTIIK
ncbi:MAG: hypothetical protein ACK4TP_09020 [Hyphomicrobium sp.]